jgi:type III pantothenate kinase
MILDIDVGNTRIKWRCAGPGATEPLQGITPRTDVHVLAQLSRRPDRIRVASVAGSTFDVSLREILRTAFGIEPEFAATTAQAGSVTCAYREPHTMGVDRWLASLAAWHRARVGVIVVSVGTALTVDAVSAAGHHAGGFIVPGLHLMQRSLGMGTVGVQVNDPWSPEHAEVAPGLSTREAVQHGVLRMAVAFVDGVVADFTNAWQSPPRLFLCGGDAPILARHLSMPNELAADLVLDGLGIALP